VWRGDSSVFYLLPLPADDAVSDFHDHFFEQKSQVTPGPIVGRGDVFDPLGQS
jgi:hypothetical protein